jgi:hypothetical protein
MTDMNAQCVWIMFPRMKNVAVVVGQKMKLMILLSFMILFPKTKKFEAKKRRH